jgi:hypothetical protein
VAACHGPSNTLLLLTAARVLFLVGHGGPGAGSSGSQQQQLQQQQVLCKFSVKVSCVDWNAWGGARAAAVIA